MERIILFNEFIDCAWCVVSTFADTEFLVFFWCQNYVLPVVSVKMILVYNKPRGGVLGHNVPKESSTGFVFLFVYWQSNWLFLK
jgi:hypothetical protein